MAQTRSNESGLQITPADVEREIMELFGESGRAGLIIRVHGEDESPLGRSEAFQVLLDSLQIYDYRGEAEEITVQPPDAEAITKALSVLGSQQLKRRLFERILLTFGKRIVDPLGEILDTTPGGALLSHMTRIREQLFGWISELKLTHETQEILTSDLKKLLSDEYLETLAEHEETVQRPRVAELAQHILHLIGTTFERAFRHWPKHAATIADSVSRRMGTSVSLRESPVVIRERIIEGIEEFLWIETSTELAGAVHQLFSQDRYLGLTADGAPEIERETYRHFAEACWEIVSENC